MDSLRITALIAAAALLPPPAGAVTGRLAGTDACAVLTADQVSAVLGVRVAPGEHIVPDAHSSCGWALPGDPSLGAKRLVLTLMTARAFDTGKTPVKGASKVAVQAIGEEAYYITTPPFGTALSVKQGGSYFQLRISGFPDAKAAHLERSLALALLKAG